MATVPQRSAVPRSLLALASWLRQRRSTALAGIPYEAVDVAAFVEAQLPAPPARVLEVCCGSGKLARALASVGYRVVAIDPRAPVGDIFESVSLEEFGGTGPFEAVVANRALHHIPSLPRALDRIARLLAGGGLLIVQEHAWERMDERTARWYLERRGA